MNRQTPGLAIAWRVAASEAGGSGHGRIECAHLLIGILSLGKASMGALRELGLPPDLMPEIDREREKVDRMCESIGATSADLRRDLRRRVKTGREHPKGVISRSPAAKAAFTRAEHLAGSEPTSAQHLLKALLKEPDAIVGEFMRDRRLSVDILEKAGKAGSGSGRTAGGTPQDAPRRSGKSATAERAPTGESALERFGRDMSAQARRGEIGPVIGRRKEILAVLQTLARSTKSNPLLIGEAGVGKTAVVEAIALRGVAGKDPAVLGGRRIIELNVGALIAGAEYRGEFEKRMKELVEELRASKDIILFIDEIHMLVGAGRAGSGPDAANLLKPVLARGEVKVIGATTPAEFRETIEKDAALERRFERINVGEPSSAEAVEILRGLRSRFEKHHRVRIGDDALQAAVSLSIRFDPEHRLPDKAVDLVDKAAARSRVPALSQKPGASGAQESIGVTVDARTVAEVLAEKRGLPIEIVANADGTSSRLLALEAQLKATIIGQDDAVARVAARVRLAHSGLSERRGPLAVFLLLGPTGVGKTEMARCLARFLFGSHDDLLRFDMSEYMEEHSVARLIGAPPGYVGHDEAGQLTEAIRRRPYSVILFDEVEKAHPKVFDLFLQLFDAGRLTDAQGRVADARNAIVVMTSNLGDTDESARAGFAGADTPRPAKGKDPRKASSVRAFFRPELLNRIDDVIALRALDEADVLRIARPLLTGVLERVRRAHGVFVRFEAEAEVLVVRSGFDSQRGVRELKRAIERLVEMPLSSLALSGKLKQHPAWKAVYDEGGIYFLPE